MNNHPPGPARLPTRDERDAIRMPRKADRFPRLSPPDVSDDNVGNAGCLLVTATRDAVVDAVSQAMDHVFESGAAHSIGELVERTAPRRILLTSQERVVLRLMRQQLTYKEIAMELGVSWHTVRSQAQSVLRKLGIHSRRDLDTWDSRLGVPLESGSFADDVRALA